MIFFTKMPTLVIFAPSAARNHSNVLLLSIHILNTSIIPKHIEKKTFSFHHNVNLNTKSLTLTPASFLKETCFQFSVKRFSYFTLHLSDTLRNDMPRWQHSVIPAQICFELANKLWLKHSWWNNVKCRNAQGQPAPHSIPIQEVSNAHLVRILVILAPKSFLLSTGE